MQIDHIALYTRDLERLCEFYTKYFDGTAGKLYQNEETGTQACFVSFADGARLEIVTRPQFEDAEHFASVDRLGTYVVQGGHSRERGRADRADALGGL